MPRRSRWRCCWWSWGPRRRGGGRAGGAPAAGRGWGWAAAGRLALALLLVIVVAAATLWPDVGMPAFGVTLVVIAVVFAARDIARHTVRSTDLPRFSAACLLTGYAWLGVAGLLWLRPELSGLRYDAVLHATFLGFVMSMVLAHAPVILPAVLRRPLPYTPAFWAVAVLLHGSLLVRVLADLAGSEAVRAVAGTLNVLALLALAATAAASSDNANLAAGMARGGPPTTRVGRRPVDQRPEA